MADFVHLHTHSDYSLLDGALRIKDMVRQAQAFGLPAVALTDHGNMFGAVELVNECKEAGLNPIVGCEFYLASGRRDNRDPAQKQPKGYHLVLLAENNIGYRNLCHLQARAWLEGRYYHPRIDKECLRQYNEGLICLTACVGGELPRRIIENNGAEAQACLEEYLAIFGPDRLFLELQNHGSAVPDEPLVNHRLAEFSRQYGLKLVATNDAHYLKKEHGKAHEVLLCIGTQTTMADAKRMQFNCHEFYYKSPAEMLELFPEWPEACANTMILHERCHVTIDTKTSHYPKYTPPTMTGAEAPEEAEAKRVAYFHELCRNGLRERYGIDLTRPETLTPADQEKVERMNFEMGVIQKMGFVSYYLVVWDFIHAARQMNVPVGPGRGSGAGSLVAYLLTITDIDPLRYGLLFERFLNPERVSPPDFDIDFCERRRHQVIEYVKKKYGDDTVCQIITYGTLKAKAVLKDVARALGRPPADGNLLSKYVPEDPKMTLAGALGEDAKHPEFASKELQELVANEPWAKEVMEYARVLEGLTRGTGIHAAGVIIGDQRLEDIVPLSKAPSEETTTQYPAPLCEKLGMLKMDFLGLKTLTIIQDAVEYVHANRGIEVDWRQIPLDDQSAFDLMSGGDTIGVFQLESEGFQKVCRKIGVDRFEDISALLAIYRPGPMQFVDDFVAGKKNPAGIEYDHPDMKPILEETYGIMLYQEQVMQAVQRIAGFSLGQADILRRAMGKKKKEEMDKMYAKFVAGCQATKGLDEARAKPIWEKIEKFAGYGFNKSHSAAYGMITYRTAYLKAHYPVEFMAAMLTAEQGNAEKLASYLQTTRDMGIEVLPPSVSVSTRTFTVDGRQIRFGLAAIKGVGDGAADAICAERKKNGKYKDLSDFCERTCTALNRRVMEALCKTGAFDEFGFKRAQIFAKLDELLANAAVAAKDRAAGQGSLFDFFSDDAGGAPLNAVAMPALPEWEDKELLGYEKELLGVYVSGHPLRGFLPVLKTYQTLSVEQIKALGTDSGDVFVRVGGMLGSFRTVASKKDPAKKFAFANLDGIADTIEVSLFNRAFEEFGGLLAPEALLFVEGKAETTDREGNPCPGKIIAERVATADQAREQWIQELHIRIRQSACSAEKLERLLRGCRETPGSTPLTLCLICDDGKIAFVQPEKLRVANRPALRELATALFGPDAVFEIAAPPVEPPRKKLFNGGRPRDD